MAEAMIEDGQADFVEKQAPSAGTKVTTEACGAGTQVTTGLGRGTFSFPLSPATL
jgi:hypothetical protein